MRRLLLRGAIWRQRRGMALALSAVGVIAVVGALTAVRRLVYGWVTLRKSALEGVGAGRPGGAGPSTGSG